MRRANDAYFTPSWMTRALLHHVPEIHGTLIEPCAGDQSIARVLSDEGGFQVFTNDIDTAQRADSHFDASMSPLWMHAPWIHWVVTNPPYSMPLCAQIVEWAIRGSSHGVAMMLRISFLEPTKLRGPFLEANPPSRVLVMPRHSFTGNGKSDSATTAWMIWSRVPLSGPPLLSLYKADERFSAPLSSGEAPPVDARSAVGQSEPGKAAGSYATVGRGSRAR